MLTHPFFARIVKRRAAVTAELRRLSMAAAANNQAHIARHYWDMYTFLLADRLDIGDGGLPDHIKEILNA